MLGGFERHDLVPVASLIAIVPLIIGEVMAIGIYIQHDSMSNQ